MDLVVEAVKIEKHQQEATSKTIAQAGAAALRQRRQWLVLESDLRLLGWFNGSKLEIRYLGLRFTLYGGPGRSVEAKLEALSNG
jgi:hypothetical protein